MANRWHICHTVIMLDPPAVTDIILETSVYCPPGPVDSGSLDGDIIYGSWWNDIPGESMY